MMIRGKPSQVIGRIGMSGSIFTSPNEHTQAHSSSTQKKGSAMSASVVKRQTSKPKS
jgi:hypothetical protein